MLWDLVAAGLGWIGVWSVGFRALGSGFRD